MSQACLHFNPFPDASSGFSAGVDRENTTEETVVRELLQNALDAGVQGDEPVKVVLGRERLLKADMPLMGDYEAAFKRAQQARAGKATPAEQSIIRRADKMLKQYRVPVLVCSDNGRGLRPGDVAGLYGTGASEAKVKRGRGSVGLGHLRAFAPSSLRYLLYASRHAPEQGRAETFAGQAILATASNGGRKISANGYVVEQPQDEVVEISDTTGVSRMPALMREWAGWSGDGTGTVVAIFGYEPLQANGDDRSESDEDLCEALFAAAAKNFAVAIWEGQFVVEWRNSDGTREVLDRDRLKSRLEVLTRKTRAKYEIGPADLTARLIGETLRSEVPKDWQHGGDVKIWWKPLEMGDTTRVCVHRDGMFITHDCPSLERRDFASSVPFLAVVDVRGDKKGSLAALVREAEGESHLRIQPSEIADEKDRKALRELLKDLGGFLRGLVPELKINRFEPEELRLGGYDEAQLYQRPRITRNKSKKDDHEDVTADDEGEEEVEKHCSTDTDADSDTRKVRRGVSPEGLQVTAITYMGDNARLRVAWNAPLLRFPTEDAGLRVCIRSGADETSQRDWDKNTEYLEIREVRVKTGCESASGPAIDGEEENGQNDIEWRLRKMKPSGVLEIDLVEEPPEADIRALAAELVQRDPVKVAPEGSSQPESDQAAA